MDHDEVSKHVPSVTLNEKMIRLRHAKVLQTGHGLCEDGLHKLLNSLFDVRLLLFSKL